MAYWDEERQERHWREEEARERETRHEEQRQAHKKAMRKLSELYNKHHEPPKPRLLPTPTPTPAQDPLPVLPIPMSVAGPVTEDTDQIFECILSDMRLDAEGWPTFKSEFEELFTYREQNRFKFLAWLCENQPEKVV